MEALLLEEVPCFNLCLRRGLLLLSIVIAIACFEQMMYMSCVLESAKIK